MNWVDHSDQMINYYNLLRQTKKYWKTHFIDIALVNSYKELNPDTKSRMSHYIFRESVVRQLYGIQVTLHQSVSGRKPPAVSLHASVRMSKPKDCAQETKTYYMTM